MKLLVLTAKPPPQSLSLVGYVEVQPIHLKWELHWRLPSSPWDARACAALLRSSTPSGAKGAKKIPCNWGKESRELSARADLVQLAPKPHCSSRVFRVLLSQQRGQGNTISHSNLFCWIQNPPLSSKKGFIWLTHLSHFVAALESGALNLKPLFPFKCR